MVRLAVLLAALLALAPATAEAARPFTIAADGANPDVAVAPGGTAHVVWDTDLSVSAFQTHPCRIAPRGRRCAPGSERVFGPYPHGRHRGSQPQVLLGARGLVVVLAGDFDPPNDATYRFVSQDGGRTFDAGAIVGGLVPASAALGPNGALGLVGVAGDAQVTSLGGAAQPIAPLMRGRAPMSQTVAFADATQVLAAGAAQPDNRILAFRGPGAWAPVPVGAGVAPSLVHSRFGTFLVYGRGDAAVYRLVMRSYNRRTGRFRRPRALGLRASYSAVTADPRGELHVALDGPSGLEVRATRRHARRLGPRRTLVRGAASFPGVRIGAGRRGRGLVLWASAGRVRGIHL